ncbi:hypothetical protein PHYPSEUDO_008040 [Phytophthora pseudosyringae]|uniref:Uncharacterized protein n=1 Tax=Phytophthora pseudosyringae TaxID=221518 RepID=A0A8T1VF66_9STRA|nr:hypothetical protein PHYPSEUDO_008040 [Phytophthora pseudosyringae]
MSFLLEDSDAQLFVPEILAMLDFDDASWSMVWGEEEPLVAACEPRPKTLRPRPVGDTEAAEPKPKKRKRVATPRLRNKAKIELLRCEIESLEAALAALQRSKRVAGSLPTTDTSSAATAERLWEGIASRQSRERERALRCNQRLKTMIAEQQTLTVSLSRLLSEDPSPPPQA